MRGGGFSSKKGGGAGAGYLERGLGGTAGAVKMLKKIDLYLLKQV